jgi:outer membrane biosynthesis protein TonB
MIKNWFLVAVATVSLFSVISGQDADAKLVSAPDFSISPEDEAAGISGTMKVAVAIDERGNVTRSSVFVTPSWPCGPDLDSRVNSIMRKAEKAVMEFKFSPATKDGKPVESAAGVSLKIGAEAKNRASFPPSDAATSAQIPKQISAGVLNGKATKLEKPRYPPEARAAGAAGTVDVQILLDEEGRIVTAQGISGHPLLHFASRDAACRSEFAPTRLQGQPVRVSGILKYNFVP